MCKPIFVPSACEAWWKSVDGHEEEIIAWLEDAIVILLLTMVEKAALSRSSQYFTDSLQSTAFSEYSSA